MQGQRAHQVEVVELHAVGVGLREVDRDLHAAHLLRPLLDAVLDDERVPAAGVDSLAGVPCGRAAHVGNCSSPLVFPIDIYAWLSVPSSRKSASSH